MKLKRTPLILQSLVVAAIACMASLSALAQDAFHPITEITASTGDTDLWAASNLIQGPGDGFDAAEPYDKLLGGDAGNWVTADPGGFPSDFIAAAGAPVLVLDLGVDLPLNEISVWGYDDTNANGAKDFSLRFATDAEGNAGFGQSITYNPSFEANNDNANARQSSAFTETVTARYVEFTATATFFTEPGDGTNGELAGGDRVGLGEIAFAVPPPPPFYPIASINSTTMDTDLWAVSNLIQGPGVGFDGAGANQKLLGGDAGNWVTADPGGFPSDFIAAGGAPVLVLDLGAEVDLREISVWGYDSSNANGVKEFSLRFATDAEGDAGFGQSITFNPTFEATNDDADARQSNLFGRTITARYVELTALDNYFTEPGDGTNGELAGGDRVGLGEIAFEILPPPFYDIVSVEVSTADTDLWPASNLIQGPDVGFSEAAPNEKLLGGDAGNWVTADPGGFPSDFIAAAGAPIITLDLGADVELSEVSVWGYDDTNANGVKEFSLRFATDAEGTAGFGQSISYNPTFAANNDDANARQSNPFSETVTARYVELTATDNYFTEPGDGTNGEPAGGDRVGLGEIAFATSVTEIVIPPLEFLPIASVETSTMADDLWPSQNLIQGPGEGFAAQEPNDALGGSDATLWVTADPGGFPSDYIEAGGAPIITLDLGADVELSEISVWGYSSGNANGVSEFSLRFATDAEGTGGFGQSITFNPSFMTEFGDRVRESFLFGQSVTARYVELTALDNFFTEPGDGTNGEPAGGDRVGLAEIAFELRLDPDGDNLSTRDELIHGTDPDVADADSDNDGDGLTALVEINQLGTLANQFDTDEDGYGDGVESNTGTFVDATNTGTDPTVADTDNDGIFDRAESDSGTDPTEADTDGDGVRDGIEVAAGTDPLNPDSFPSFPVPIAYWSFDDQGPATTTDVGPVGTVNGSPEWVAGHTGEPNDFAIKFDGEDDSVTTDVSLLNDLTDITIAFWVRIEEEQLGERVGLVGQNDLIEYGMISAGTMQWWTAPGGEEDNFNIEFGPVVEEWTHVAVVRNAEFSKIFIDGELAEEAAGGGPGTSGDTLNIGGDGVFDAEGNFFLGEIDDVAVWDASLTEDEIADLAAGVVCPLGACDGSSFDITEVSRAADGTVSLTWSSTPSKFYDIEASPDMSSGSWVPMGVAIPGQGGEELVTSAMVTSDAALSMEYFRVIQVSAPPFVETSFEDGLGDWTTTSAAGTMWEVGTPTAGPPAAKTGDNVAGTGLAGDYEDGTVGSLRTPVIDTFGNRVSLSFSYFLEAVEGEGGRVNLLEADGTLIQSLEPIYTGGEDGNTADWSDVSFRLPKLDPARPFIVEFEFLTTDDGDPNNGAGWFIDDVLIAK